MILSKNKGQHILKSQTILNQILKLVPDSNLPYLEIGPGTGNLTEKLLTKNSVNAIELDPRMVQHLNHRFQNSKLNLVCGDFLKTELPPFEVCVSNVPYNISSPLLFKLLHSKARECILMFQKEFADRLLARPGDSNYSKLTVASELYCESEFLLSVGRQHFLPEPEVDSSVVRLKISPKYKVDSYQFEELLKVCFLRKNRVLSSLFKEKSVLSKLNCKEPHLKDFVLEILKSLDLTEARAKKTRLSEFYSLHNCLKEKQVYFK